MVDWRQFRTDAPELAERVAATFARGRHCTLATVRSDGSPRISGTEVEFADDDGVYLGMMPGSMKSRDVQHDPRVAVHSPTADPPSDDPAGWPGEAKFSGVAVPADPPPGMPEALRFRVDLTSVVFTRIAPSGTELEITWWRPGHPVRRVTRA